MICEMNSSCVLTYFRGGANGRMLYLYVVVLACLPAFPYSLPFFLLKNKNPDFLPKPHGITLSLALFPVRSSLRPCVRVCVFVSVHESIQFEYNYHPHHRYRPWHDVRTTTTTSRRRSSIGGIEHNLQTGLYVGKGFLVPLPFFSISLSFLLAGWHLF